MTTLVWDKTGERFFETGASKGILFPIDGSPGVPWNGLQAVSVDPQGGEPEHYYFDGIKYMDQILSEDFQATITAVSTPKEFEVCEGVKEYAPGVKTAFNKREKFHMSWRTEIGNDENPMLAYKIHIAYNNLVQPSARAYPTIADTTTMESRSFVITSTPACGRHSYFWFDSREYDLTALEAQLKSGVIPKCWELGGLVSPIGGGGGGGTPSDPDLGCPSLEETLEEYNPGLVISGDDKPDTSNKTDVYVEGTINNGLDIVELPAEGDFAVNDSAASVTGTGNVLADDDDASYISSADGDLGWTIGLPPLVGYVDGSRIELHIRMSISGGVSEDDPDNIDADAQVHISTDAEGDNTIGGFSDGRDEGMGFSLSAVDGSIVDYVIPLNMDPWVNSDLPTLISALEAGAYLNFVGATNNNPDTTPEVDVYEAKLVVINNTDRDRWLRTSDPSTDGLIQMGIYEAEDLLDPMVVANTAYVDFKVFGVPNNEDSAGLTVQPMEFFDTGPGPLEIHLNANYPLIVWYNSDSSEVLASAFPNLNVWYRAEARREYGSCRMLVYPRDVPGDYIIDFTENIEENPVALTRFWCGMVGN